MSHLAEVVEKALESFHKITQDAWEKKPQPHKWSKQEILGHLVDSAINNLQRFTEIQYSPKPYKVRPYQQDALVEANRYQGREVAEIIGLWTALNQHISHVMQQQDQHTLAYEVILPEGDATNLQWLMDDYVVHLHHHLKQIIS